MFDVEIMQELEELLGDSLQMLLQVFRDDSVRLVDLIGVAIETNDREQLRLHTHSLKGASSNLGATDIYACCMRLENLAASATETELFNMHRELTDRHTQALVALKVLLVEQG